MHAANADKSAQLSAILNRLRQGPATTAELHEVSGSMVVSTRIAELRQQPSELIIACIRAAGIYTYHLTGYGKED